MENSITDPELYANLEKLKNQFENASEDIRLRFEDKVTKIQQGDDLLPTVMKVVKVFVAVKRSLCQETRWLVDMVIKVW